MSENSNPVDWSAVSLACIIRILFWGSTIFIIYLCFDSGYSLTTLHVAFSTLGCGLLMVEAILVVTGDALLTKIFPNMDRPLIHKTLFYLGQVSLGVGVVAIVRNQYLYNINRYSSNHGKVGLAAFITELVILGCSMVTMPIVVRVYKESFPLIVPILGSFKRAHIYLGIITMILLWAAEITGFYTSWWTASTPVTNLMLVAYVIGGFFLLAENLCWTLWHSFG